MTSRATTWRSNLLSYTHRAWFLYGFLKPYCDILSYFAYHVNRIFRNMFEHRQAALSKILQFVKATP